jgi:DHA2 family multidrug resistance protein-like MFS transporter
MTVTMLNAPAQKAGRREWTGLAVLALPTLLLALDASVLYLALPHLAADLGAGATAQLWITDIYGFMIAGFLVTMGTLGDRIGRRKLLLAGAAFFSVASVAAAFSRSAAMLIAARAVLGIAGATLMPSTLALITNLFRDPRQRGTALAVWASCFMGGAAVGPVVGGVLLEHFWWGSAFLLGVPVMVVLLVSAPVLLPESRNPNAGRLDLVSVGMSLGAMLPAVFGLKELARTGPGALPLAALATGLAVGAAFVARQRRLADPLVDVRLFADRAFSSAIAVWVMVGTFMGGIALVNSLYLQTVAGLATLQAGLWQVPSSLAMIGATMAAPVLARRVRPGYVMAGGLAAAALGFVLLTQVGVTGGLPLLVAGSIVMAVGVGVGMPLGTGLVIGAAPPEKAGAASAISETSGELGVALGVAVLGSLTSAVYRAGIDLPAGLPAGAADAVRESIAGAAATAAQLPGGLGATVLELARTSFTTGLHVVAALSAIAFALMTVLAARGLRHVPATGAAEPDHEAELTQLAA